MGQSMQEEGNFDKLYDNYKWTLKYLQRKFQKERRCWIDALLASTPVTGTEYLLAEHVAGDGKLSNC